jgi:pyruvate kinase
MADFHPMPTSGVLTRTKIVATVGPASDATSTLRAMAAAGMDVARVPMAHGTLDDAMARVRRIREAVPGVGIMADLPGPKIRCAAFPDGGVQLVTGSRLALVEASDGEGSSDSRIGVCHPDLVAGLRHGDLVALGDGGVILAVARSAGAGAGTVAGVEAVVQSGGRVQGRPGITAPSGRIPIVTPTAEDLVRLAALVAEGVDAVAVSFVRSAVDIEAIRKAAGGDCPMLIAKIETPEAVAELEGIVAVADAVMVARGDLGVRMALEDVPHIQKRIIRSAVRYGRPVITATQMLESMIYAPVPTRAEVADVANAVLDGTSALMLSAETAIGADPVTVVATMARIARRAEREFDFLGWGSALAPQAVVGDPFSSVRLTAATTAAGWRAALEEDAACIVACTNSGATARAISRFRPSMPIVACTPSDRTARQLTLSWGVQTITLGEASSTDEIVWFAVQAVVQAGYAAAGDVVVVLAGSPTEPEPATDTMRLVRIR